MGVPLLACRGLGCDTRAMSVSVLEREMYTEAAAARLLRVAPSTLHYWLEGGNQRGKLYKPVIRIEARGPGAAVTWAEFVEAALLRTYRRGHQGPPKGVRGFIDGMRQEFHVPYPLADRRPYVAAGRKPRIDPRKPKGPT